MTTENKGVDEEVYYLYPPDGFKWGNWKFDAAKLQLQHPTVGSVELSTLNTSREILTMILFIRTENVNQEEIGDFVEAVDELLNPYLNLFRYHWQRGVYGEKPFNARSYVLQELAKGTQGPYVCKPWKPEPKEAA